MKIRISIILFICAGSLFSQELDRCRNLTNLIFEGINNNSSEEIMPYLSDDFMIAGKSGEVAKVIVNQLFSGLNETILEKDEIEAKRFDNKLKLSYKVNYKNLGVKRSEFFFNNENQIIEISLFPIQIKTLDGDAEVQDNSNDILNIPFNFISKLLGVEVIVNNHKRTFIFDSGSPKVVLNSKYYKNTDNSGSLSNVNAVNGSINGMDIYKVDSLNFNGMQIINQDLLTVNLSEIEKEFKTEIHGLIGYELFKGYDLLLDYKQQIISLIRPKLLDSLLNTSNFHITTFEMVGHLPVVSTRIEDSSLMLGIDSGAETNLLDNKYLKKFNESIFDIKNDTITGAGNKSISSKKGKIKKLTIANKSFFNSPFFFSSTDYFNELGKNLIVGLVGYPILVEQRTIISYSRKQLIFLD